MRAGLEQWSNGRVRIHVKGAPEELRQLAAALQALSRTEDQHFHVSDSGDNASRVEDIEFGVDAGAGAGGMRLLSFAVAPGTEIPDPGSRGSGSVRRTLPWLWLVGLGLVVGGLIGLLWNGEPSVVTPGLAMLAGAVVLGVTRLGVR